MTGRGKAGWWAFAACLMVSGCTTDGAVKPESPSPAPEGAGTLARIERLKPDTSEAALHDNALSGIPYIGVWAGDGAGCARIDQDGYDRYAVITIKSMRRANATCALLTEPPTANPELVTATCMANGETSVRALTVEMDGLNRMKVTDLGKTEPYIRCVLP
ncbi:MAG: hypothetical protein WAT70_03585 [Rhizobiaceae bacterium]